MTTFVGEKPHGQVLDLSVRSVSKAIRYEW